MEGFGAYHTVTFPENIYAKFGLKTGTVTTSILNVVEITTQSFKDPWKYLTLINGKINYIIVTVGRTIKRKQATTGVCLFTPNSIVLFCSIVDMFLKQLHDERKLAANCVLSVITPRKIGKNFYDISLEHNKDQLSKTLVW